LSAKKGFAAFFLVFAGFLAGALAGQITDPYKHLWNHDLYALGKSPLRLLSDAMKSDKTERLGIGVITNGSIHAALKTELLSSGHRMVVMLIDKNGTVLKKNFGN
jgi:hypothetical protein